MKAGEIMTRDVITIRPYAKIYELTKLLVEARVSGMPVCDDMGQVLGMVSEADLICLERGNRVEDIMCRDIVFVDVDTPVEIVASTMLEHNIKRVPVYSKGRMVGIISRADIVAAMANRKISV